MKRGDTLRSIFQAGIEAVNPYKLVLLTMGINGHTLHIGEACYDVDYFKKIIVVGAGKATAPMARAVEEVLGKRISSGLIVVKYGHTCPLKKINHVEAGHPLSDKSGRKGTEEIVKLLKEADEKTLVLCLLSGGASSLLISPVEGITLKNKQKVTELLLSAGAKIDELNIVRKHLSKIKGGRLAEITYPATLLTLILSDVIGDRLDVIASGPTVPDSTTFREAMEVIEKYRLGDRLPLRVIRLLKQGLTGRIKDTPKGGEPFFRKTRTVIIGDIRQALLTGKEKALSMGLEAEVHTSELQGEARDVARYLSTRAIEIQNSMRMGDKPRCLLSGGETTVSVKGNGLGGRNQELALAFAIDIKGINKISMLSAGTDGTDGPTDAAGAIVDGETVTRAKEFGIDPVDYLENNDSYNFFKKLDSLSGENHHLITGPTETNVMDMQIIMIENTCLI